MEKVPQGGVNGHVLILTPALRGHSDVPHLRDPLWAPGFMATLTSQTAASQRNENLLVAGANRASRCHPGAPGGISC